MPERFDLSHLVVPGTSATDAETVIRDACGSGFLEALDPHSPRGRIQVRVDPDHAVDHLLWKPDGARRFEDRFTRPKGGFLSERADHIRLLEESLLRPDKVLQERSHPQALCYALNLRENLWLLSIIDRPKNKYSQFRSFYPVLNESKEHQRDWRRRLRESIEVYSKPAPKLYTLTGELGGASKEDAGTKEAGV